MHQKENIFGHYIDVYRVLRIQTKFDALDSLRQTNVSTWFYKINHCSGLEKDLKIEFQVVEKQCKKVTPLTESILSYIQQKKRERARYFNIRIKQQSLRKTLSKLDVIVKNYYVWKH